MRRRLTNACSGRETSSGCPASASSLCARIAYSMAAGVCSSSTCGRKPPCIRIDCGPSHSERHCSKTAKRSSRYSSNLWLKHFGFLRTARYVIKRPSLHTPGLLALRFKARAVASWRAGCLRASMKVGLISASSSSSLIASRRRSPRMTALRISRRSAYSGTPLIGTCELSKASNDSQAEGNGVVGAPRQSALASLPRRMSAAARSSSWLGACCA